MSQSEKAFYYQGLKTAGVEFAKPYRNHTVAELKAGYDKLVEAGAAAPYAPEQEQPEPEPVPMQQSHPSPPESEGGPLSGYQGPPLPQQDVPPPDPEAAAFFGFPVPDDEPPAASPAPEMPSVPIAHADPEERAGARLNSATPDVPIRIDPETGRAWFQEEVRKPAYPKPRGRRVLRYMDSGVKQQTVKAGDYTETFEIPGDPANAREQEVKITLPSYQVGIYKDPRFPFRVVTYNDNEGFHREDVADYWGGAELVPQWIKRKYVENVLCYDIRSVVQQINNEYRELQLAGKVE